MLFSVSVSGINAGLRRQEVSANNLANLVTPGYKTQRVDQADVAPSGTQVAGIDTLFTAGPLEIDGGFFSLAVLGDGLFRVDTPQGDRFTRAGNFHIDAEGFVVDSEGHRLQPDLQVPSDAKSVVVDANGQVSAVNAQGEVDTIGQIELSRFANPGGLSREGGNLLAATAASGAAMGGLPNQGSFGSIAFGALEQSNVDLSSEMVGALISRALVRANVASIRTQDEMLGSILDLRR